MEEDPKSVSIAVKFKPRRIISVADNISTKIAVKIKVKQLKLSRLKI